MSLWRCMCREKHKFQYQIIFRSSSSNLKSKALFSNSIVNCFPDTDKILYPFVSAVETQSQLVKNLKLNNALPEDLHKAILELKARKQLLEKKEQELCPPIVKVDKAKLDDLLKQRFFFDQAFSIYGGVQGLYDFGPAGCAVKSNLLQDWRKFFVLSDGMLEVDCPVLTPEPVLRASGHVDRFTDYLVSDSLTGESYRADHLVKQSLEAVAASPGGGEGRVEAEQAIARLDALDEDGLQELIRRFGITAPSTGNPLTPPRRFNLMFETASGAPGVDQRHPQQRHKLYLRPETAQGVFTNFRRLLDFHRGRLPMAAAQVGPSYRNEIQPRSGLLRLREFCMAEIEHFYDPLDSRHADFASVAELSLPLLSAADQLRGSKAKWHQLQAALATGLLTNETLAYYLGRVHLFLTQRCGIDPRRLRFRQHPVGEMAHYASDCWDAECLVTSAGAAEPIWLECVGCADRSAYDLSRHSDASGERLVATRLAVGGAPSESPVQFTPSVVEPSFGIGRVLSAVFEHSFRHRPGADAQRTYLALPAWLAPHQCAVLAMNPGRPDMLGLVKRLTSQLARLGLSAWRDSDARAVSIGKRYARADQLGVPYAATVDFDSVAEGDRPPTVTLRERDSMLQVRLELEQVPELVRQLVEERTTWQQVTQSHPLFRGQSCTKSAP